MPIHPRETDEKYEQAFDRFSEDLERILKSNLKEIVIHGSCVLDDFQIASSDLDFLVVTKQNLDDTSVSGLFHLHDKYRSTKPLLLQKLEGTYYPGFFLEKLQASFRGCYIGTGRSGWRPITTLQNSFMDLRLINSSGVALLGSSPDIYNPTEEEILQEQIADLIAFRKSAQRATDSSDELWPTLIHWCARTLFYRKTGAITSKTEACRWCIRQPHLKAFKVLFKDSVRCRLKPEESELKDGYKDEAIILLTLVDDTLQNIEKQVLDID